MNLYVVELGQHRSSNVTLLHKFITCTNLTYTYIYLSPLMICDIHLRTNSQFENDHQMH